MSNIRRVRIPYGVTAKRIWLSLVIIYAAVRAITADLLLGHYGLSGQAYFTVEILTSIPFARFSGYLVEDLADDRSWWRNAVIVGSTYAAPDLYLLAVIHSAPSRIYLAAIVVIMTLGIISAAVIVRRLKDFQLSLEE